MTISGFRRASRAIFYSLSISLMPLASACGTNGKLTINKGSSNTAESFGGSDHVSDKLEIVRNNILVPAVRGIIEGKNLAELCDFSSCNESQACANLPTIPAAQATFCKYFIIAAAPALLNRLLSNEIVVRAIAGELYVDGDAVVARTSNGLTGSVEVSTPRFDSLKPTNALVASILAHEFLHKIPYGAADRFILDRETIGPFASARGGNQLLTISGIALSLYAEKLGLLGASLPLPSPSPVDPVTGGDTAGLASSVSEPPAYVVPPYGVGDEMLGL